MPVPDPTTLTTNAVRAAREEIEKLFEVKLGGLRELLEEKFAGVKTEFTMRDIALAAAFKAAEAAVKQQNESNTLAIDKAATATTKQIDGLVERIDDLKERIQDDRGSSSGGRREIIAWFFAAVGGVAAVVAIVGFILKLS